MSQDQDGISLPVPCFGACHGRERLGGEKTSSNSGAGGGGGGIPAAGTFWQDSVMGGVSPTPGSCPMEGGGLLSTGKSCKSRPVTVAYVVNGEASQQSNAESMALQCLKDACETVGSKLETVNFGKLDFGETTVLDSFYNAGESSQHPTTHRSSKPHVPDNMKYKCLYSLYQSHNLSCRCGQIGWWNFLHQSSSSGFTGFNFALHYNN